MALLEILAGLGKGLNQSVDDLIQAAAEKRRQEGAIAQLREASSLNRLADLNKLQSSLGLVSGALGGPQVLPPSRATITPFGARKISEQLLPLAQAKGANVSLGPGGASLESIPYRPQAPKELTPAQQFFSKQSDQVKALLQLYEKGGDLDRAIIIQQLTKLGVIPQLPGPSAPQAPGIIEAGESVSQPRPVPEVKGKTTGMTVEEYIKALRTKNAPREKIIQGLREEFGITLK